MALIKELSQKIRHPRTKRWVETTYFMGDPQDESVSPSIYVHGKLADEGAVEQKNLSPNLLSYISHVESSYDRENENLILTISRR